MASNYTSSRPDSNDESNSSRVNLGEYVKLTNVVPSHQITVKMHQNKGVSKQKQLIKGSSRSLLLHNLHKSALASSQAVSNSKLPHISGKNQRNLSQALEATETMTKIKQQVSNMNVNEATPKTDTTPKAANRTVYNS